MKTSYQTFLNELLQHGDKYRAYKAAYPKASGNALKVAANRLLRRADIKQVLAQANQQARAKAITVLEEDTLHQTKQQFTSIYQKRAVLHQMITGQWQVERHIKLNNQIETIVEQLNPFAVLRAIALDIKLEEQQQELEKAKQVAEQEQAKEQKAKQMAESKPLYHHPQRESFPKNGTAEQMCQWYRKHDGEGSCWVTEQNVFVYEHYEGKVRAHTQLTPEQAAHTSLKREASIATEPYKADESYEEEEFSQMSLTDGNIEEDTTPKQSKEDTEWSTYVSLGGIASNLNLDAEQLKRNFLNQSSKQRKQLIAPLLEGSIRKQKRA